MVDEDYVKMIGGAFGLGGDVLPAPDGSAFFMAGGISDTLQLRVDAHSGGFLFQNLDKLWNHPEMTRTLPISPGEVEAMSNSFLREHQHSLPGALGFDSSIAPMVVLEGPVEMMAAANGALVQAGQQGMDWGVSYARTVVVSPTLKLSVVGPGSRQNVYIGEDGEVIGMKGGWRDVQTMLHSTEGVEAPTVVTVPIKTADEAWAEFLANPDIALAQPPLALYYDRTGKPDPTLAYYELTLSISQTELIPVWLFVADLYTDTIPPTVQVQATEAITALVASDVKIYIPAEAGAAGLEATIEQPHAGTAVSPGTSLDLVGSASGGLPPYSFHWSSSKDGDLGSGDMLTVPGLSPDVHGGQNQPNMITLLVMDANGQTATDMVDVTVYTPVYIPIVLKNAP
jgi:hypothetical protein